MSIILSDPGMDNPIIWNFGKIEIKFSKPMDPLSINESFKNPQKPKIEQSFAPEEHSKTSLVRNHIIKKTNYIRRHQFFPLL